jgi:hypothetical protein
MTARQHPLILTGTCLRMSKLKDAAPTVAVRIKMCGTKEELVTTMVNPFHAQQGGSFNLGKALKKVAKGAKAAAPYVSAASDAAILAGTVTGQPEVVALGAAGKAASKLAGAGKKKQPMKPARYRLSQDPTQI